jgi:hypothetical protein
MNKHAACAAALAALCLQQAHAGPADYVYVPTVEYGERELDFKFGTAHEPGEERESAGSIGFGLGVTPWWFTELYAKFEREGSEATKLEAVEWENKFQLTETGKYPFDLGLIVELERPQDHAEGWEVKLGPLLQTEFGKVQVNANLLFERHFDAEEKSETELGYQWQAKYRWRQELEFGAQGFGEVGEWDNWEASDEQEHKAGPAVFGKLPLGGHQAIKYNAAYLIGLSDAAPDHTLRVQVEYEF